MVKQEARSDDNQMIEEATDRTSKGFQRDNMRTQSIVIIILLFSGLFRLAAQNSSKEGSYFLLDDFSGEFSKIGTEWEGFTDRVMGGVSDMAVNRVLEPGNPYIRMRGHVSLERNGGFIQIRLALAGKGKYFDGTVYKGIRVTVRGEGSGYYIFLRNSSTIFPWKYYAAPVPVSAEWTTVDIPWSAFGPGNYGRVPPLKVSKLRSFALTAYGEEFDAQIDLKEIGLFF